MRVTVTRQKSFFRFTERSSKTESDIVDGIGAGIDMSAFTDKAIMAKIGRMIEGAILSNIKNGRQANGSPIKINSPSWLRFKRMMGWGAKPLVAEKHRFTQRGQKSWKNVPTRTSVEVMPATSELRDLVQWVQENKYVGWFALSAEHIKAIRITMRDYVVAKIRRKLARQQDKQQALVKK